MIHTPATAKRRFNNAKRSLSVIVGILFLFCVRPLLVTFFELNQLDSARKIAHSIKEDENQTKTSVCDVSGSSNVIITNYTKSAFTSLDKLVIMDKVAVLEQKDPSRPAYATCRQFPYMLSAHFPHLMQQIYRCWSFWQNHPEKIAVFLTVDENTEIHRMMGQAFNRGILEILPDMGVQVVRPSDVGLGSFQNLERGGLTGWLTRKFKDSLPDIGARVKARKETGSISGRAIFPIGPPWKDYYQSTSSNDMRTLRQRALSALSLNSTESLPCQLGGEPGQVPRITVLNRKSNRQLLNVDELVADLRESLQLSYDIPVIDFEKATFRDQVKTFSVTDILVTPHGAQEAGIVFMPQCAGVLEMFPEGFFLPKFFGSLAASAGLDHAYLYLSKNSPRPILDVKAEARLLDFCPPIDRVREGVVLLVERWRKCCNAL